MGSSSTSKPATIALPAVGGKKHVSIRMVVVLPAPLGPRKPTIWPFSTSNEMWSTAVCRAYLFVSSVTVIIKFYFLKTRSTALRTIPSTFKHRRPNYYGKKGRPSCQPFIHTPTDGTDDSICPRPGSDAQDSLRSGRKLVRFDFR